MARSAWIRGEAPHFLTHLIGEALGIDRILQEMEHHYARPFSEDDAVDMRDAMCEMGEQ